MRIACPTCDATYEVPDALIGAGRMLRCAKCTHEWLAGPESRSAPAAAAAAAAEASPAPRPVADAAPPPMTEARQPAPPAAAPAAREGGRSAAALLWAAWIGSGLLLCAMGAGAWAYRGPIVEAWPPAARVYRLFGADAGESARQGADRAARQGAERAARRLAGSRGRIGTPAKEAAMESSMATVEEMA